MKFLLVLVVIVGVAQGASWRRWFGLEPASIVNDGLNAILESIRVDMPCGWAAENIPPLAPLTVDKYPIDIDLDGFKATGVFENLRITRLNSFVTRVIALDMSKLQITFDIVIPQVDITGLYNLVGSTPEHSSFHGEGPFEASLFDISLVGTAQLAIQSGTKLHEFDTKLSMSRFAVNFHGMDGVSNNKLNEVIAKLIADNRATIIEHIHDIVLPDGNVMLGHMKFRTLLNRIKDAAEAPPKEQCLPA